MRMDRTVSAAALEVEAGFRRQAGRLAVVAGLLLTAVGSFLPWIEGADLLSQRIVVDGLSRQADGALLIIVGMGQTGIVLSRSAAESRTMVIRVLPTVLGLVVLLTALTAHLDAATVIHGIESDGGTASISAGIWVATAGAALGALGGAWVTLSDRVRRGEWMTPGEYRQVLDRRTLVPVVAGLVGAAAGFAVGIMTALIGRTPDLTWGYVLIAALGTVLGGLVGHRIGRRLVGRHP